MDEAQLGEAKNRLQELRRELEQDIASKSAADDSITPDNAIGRLTRMEAIQAQSISDAGRERARKRLNQVDIALKRVDDGTYGTCVQCGRAIAGGRLDVMPESRLCAGCAGRIR